MTEENRASALAETIPRFLSSADRSASFASGGAVAACGPRFSRFADLENEPLQSFLYIVRQHSAEINPHTASLRNSLSDPLAEFVDVPNLIADIAAKRDHGKAVGKRLSQHTSQLSASAAKIASAKVVTEADKAKLDALKLDHDYLFRQQEALIVLAEETEEQMREEECLYQHELFLRCIKTLRAFARERLAPCAKIVARTPDLRHAGATLPDVDDQELPELEQKLADLKRELNDEK
jgi:hypothetical protein